MQAIEEQWLRYDAKVKTAEELLAYLQAGDGSFPDRYRNEKIINIAFNAIIDELKIYKAVNESRADRLKKVIDDKGIEN
jgi:uncharacterized lipoprotein YajG